MIFSLIFYVFAQDPSWEVRKDPLREGLSLYTHIVPNTKMISVMFRYRLFDDFPDGSAHFVEHLMFAYRDQEQTYDQILENIGGESQGRTDLATIKLNVRIPIESWNAWVQLERNRQEFVCNNIEDDIFESQRMVIVQEYMQGMTSLKRAYAQELREAVFGNRELGRSVIGSIDDISDWSKEQICAYMNRIIVRASVDVFVVGDIGGIDVGHDIQTIFSTHRRAEVVPVEEQKFTLSQIEHTGTQETLYILWPIPDQIHDDTILLRYWMLMMTHTRFGVLHKNGIQARGWMEYGSQGGYLLLHVQGKKVSDLERDIRDHMYGLGGWMTVWRYASLVSKVYHRSVIHSWKTLDGRLLWLEQCLQEDALATCFEIRDDFSNRDLDRVKKQWLRWDQASTLRVVSP
ncbi:MAG: hypothetical protein CL916_01065 [Deltaproteobacteria bacterium]|nr:hypothetical protein [Deltaproteobacteria bacterium]